MAYGTAGGNFAHKLVLMQISVVFQLEMNTCVLAKKKSLGIQYISRNILGKYKLFNLIFNSLQRQHYIRTLYKYSTEHLVHYYN